MATKHLTLKCLSWFLSAFSTDNSVNIIVISSLFLVSAPANITASKKGIAGKILLPRDPEFEGM